MMVKYVTLCSLVAVFALATAHPAPAASYVDLVKNDPGLVSYWRFEGEIGPGEIVEDENGNANPGTFNPDSFPDDFVADPDGVVGQAVEMSGEPFAVVEIDNEENFDFTDSMSVEAWIRTDGWDKSWQAIVNKGDDQWRLHRHSGDDGIAFGTDELGQNRDTPNTFTDVIDGEWHHLVAVFDGTNSYADPAGEQKYVFIDGELEATQEITGPLDTDRGATTDLPVMIGGNAQDNSHWRAFTGSIDEVAVYDRALSADDILEHFNAEKIEGGGEPMLQAGDADQNLEFNQLDLVKVQIAAKYMTGQPATWGDGDWNGAPGGSVGNPPAGDNLFNQLDIIAALNNGLYMTGPYAAIVKGGTPGDAQTSITYNVGTGEVGVDAPAGVELTSVNIESASSIFTGEPAQNLGGSFDNDADNNIFKATFGGSFGSLSFGTVAQAGLSEDFVANDLTVVGSLAGGGDLGNVDLIYIPEPAAIVLLVVGIAGVLLVRRRG